MINGLGLGNSTRCYAIIEHLAEAGVKTHVLTSGNGLTFFKDKPEIASLTPMDSFFYSVHNKKLSALKTIASLGELCRRAQKKRSQLESLIEKIKPDLAVTDSEYTIRPFTKRGIPVVAVNNSDVVVDEYLRRKNHPRSIMAQFWIVEFLDYLFHRQFVDMVISPSAKPIPPRHPKIKRVGLIVRREIRSQAVKARQVPRPQPRDIKSLVFMLSGSILGFTKNLAFHELPCKVAVIGRDGPSDDQVTYHGRVTDNADKLSEADALIINGGFSAVSEALALGKPCLVIPVPRHAEQYINASQVVDLGHGYLTDEDTVIAKLKELYEANYWVGLPEKPETVDIDGAAQAAEFILGLLEKRKRE